MKYYFAVVSCDSINTAISIYDNIDGNIRNNEIGTEYLQSGNLFDMRYIPDDIELDKNTLFSECNEIPENYKPIDFETSALDHSKVDLTWDRDEVKLEYDVEIGFIIELGKQKLQYYGK